jgi:hypothetical protein
MVLLRPFELARKTGNLGTGTHFGGNPVDQALPYTKAL